MTLRYKKLLAAAASAIIAPFLILPALAEDAATLPPAVPPPPKQTLVINVRGLVEMMNGEVTAVGADSLKVKVWGIEFTVKVRSGTKIGHKVAGAEAGLADFKVGDRVKLSGTTAGDQVIEASMINNLSLKQQVENERKSKRSKELKKNLEKGKKKPEESKERPRGRKSATSTKAD